MGSLFLVYGCFQHKKQLSRRIPIGQIVINDAEIQLLLPLLNGEKNMPFIEKRRPLWFKDSRVLCQALPYYISGIYYLDFLRVGIVLDDYLWWSVMLVFVEKQTSAGAAVLTDSIYWTVIFPFLSLQLQDYEMSFVSFRSIFIKEFFLTI